MSAKNAFWRKEVGPTPKATTLLRFPTRLVALLNERKPAGQSLTSFIGDCVLRGLGEDPLKWRYPLDFEDAEGRKTRSAALVTDECGIIEHATAEVLASLPVLNMDSAPPEFDGDTIDVGPVQVGRINEDGDLEW